MSIEVDDHEYHFRGFEQSKMSESENVLAMYRASLKGSDEEECSMCALYVALS